MWRRGASNIDGCRFGDERKGGVRNRVDGDERCEFRTKVRVEGKR
jgi:hypothetical protein